MFSERGYTAVEIDINAPEESASTRESLQVMAKGSSSSPNEGSTLTIRRFYICRTVTTDPSDDDSLSAHHRFDRIVDPTLASFHL